MAKVNVRLPTLLKIQAVFSSEKVSGRIARFAIRRIKDKSREGDSLKTGKPFKPLTNATDRRKEMLAQLNKVSKFYVPGISNVTFTGQLLNAITFKLKNGLAGKLINIFVKDSKRRPVKGLRGKKLKSKTNKQVAEEVAENGRPILGMDSEGTRQIKRILLSEIKKEIRRSR